MANATPVDSVAAITFASVAIDSLRNSGRARACVDNVDADCRDAQRLRRLGRPRTQLDLFVRTFRKAIEHAQGGDLLAGRAGIGLRPRDSGIGGQGIFRAVMDHPRQGEIVVDGHFHAFGPDAFQAGPAVFLAGVPEHRIADRDRQVRCACSPCGSCKTRRKGEARHIVRRYNRGDLDA